MPFESEDAPTRRLGREAALPRDGEEPFRAALERVRERCRLVHERCMRAARAERQSDNDARRSATPVVSPEELDEFVRALDTRLNADLDDAERHIDAAPITPLGNSPDNEDEELQFWRELFVAGSDETTGKTPAHRFAVLWAALAEIAGPAATATLIGRAARAAAPRAPELAALEIARAGFEYRYVLPHSWQEPDAPFDPLRELVLDLRPLLVEVAGPVLLNRLRAVGERGTGTFARLLGDAEGKGRVAVRSSGPSATGDGLGE